MFSSGGRSVYLIQFQSAKLTRVDLDALASSELDLSAFIQGGEIRAIGRSIAGELLIATDARVWAYDPAKAACKKLCTAEEGSKFTDLACDPKTGALLLAITKGDAEGARYLPAGYNNTVSVVVRRVVEFDGMAFSPGGELYFGTRGDLWSGKIEPDAPNGPSGLIDRGVLVATRCAPLATLETANTTPGQIGVQEVSVAGDKVYVHLRRLGGSGWGNIVRLNRPALEEERILEKRLKLYAEQVESVEVLCETNGTRSYVCSSQDGKMVFFTTGNFGAQETKCFLVKNGGEPRALSLKKSQ